MVRHLLAGVLERRKLPFEVRTGTKETRSGVPGGLDRPDLAFYDAGEFPVVYVEVKLPSVEITDMAASTERNDQIGRYLAAADVVLLCNVDSVPPSGVRDLS